MYARVRSGCSGLHVNTIPRSIELSRYSQRPSGTLMFQSIRHYAYDGSKPESPQKSEIARLEKITPTRQKIKDQRHHHTKKIQLIDEKYDIFNADVRRVVDLGCAPGLWMKYAKDRILWNHRLSEAGFCDEGFIVGLDILSTTPPTGTSTLQGNLISKYSMQRTLDLCKELAYRQEAKRNELATPLKEEVIDENGDLIETENDVDTTYFGKEQIDINNELKLKESRANVDYKVDLVLSDLTSTLKQDRGFWNNTQTKPYLRIATNPKLMSTVRDQTKAPFDLADAALVYAIRLLKENGTFVLRMNAIHPEDPEIELLTWRLRSVFRSVESTEHLDSFSGVEFFLICKGKDDSVDVVEAFSYKAKL
ncbi:rRNA methyltransferase 2, mitochondrial [[Candida] railenensis]|uniref:rRNA methyltransferase 2, mitochondrial n=1 Tax=[Candida] railenensis TaxID=45579 RepID=A0A9P0VYS7_9ASCO|nr:rRNA methyltransferase 2, mitochondrial [[Candida] railenensis]